MPVLFNKNLFWWNTYMKKHKLDQTFIMESNKKSAHT